MRARLLDPGAVFAGWVGLGMALVLVIAFELIIPIQPVVFLLAPVMGILIGVYANVRSERRRPAGRVVANASYAGLVGGLGMAILYVLIRLVFIYGDTGALPDGTSLACHMGPDCNYARRVAAGQAGDLAASGIVDAATLESAALDELGTAGIRLVVLTLVGSVAAGVGRAITAGRMVAPEESVGTSSS